MITGGTWGTPHIWALSAGNLDLAEFSLQTMIAELMILYFPMAQSAMCDPVQIGYRL